MKALVINLDDAVERMEFQQQQLNRLGIKFKRLPAVKISSDNEIYQKFYKTWERPLRTSEVSCFFSHKNAWEQVIENNEPLLVLEDDAFLVDEVCCLLASLEELNDIDYVNLEVTGTKKKRLVSKEHLDICESSLFRLYQGRSGAGGYVIWPSGARKLLEKMKKGGIGLADKFINSCYSLHAYQIEPACLIQLDQCVFYDVVAPLQSQSTISVSSTLLVDDFFCFQCRYRRLIGQIKIAINRLIHVRKTILRQIALSDSFKKIDSD